VETGLFGTRQSFAPIRGSRFDGEQLVVLAVTKDQVKDAPNIDPDARISESERGRPPPVLQRLTRHRRADQRSRRKVYGRSRGRPRRDAAGRPTGAVVAGPIALTDLLTTTLDYPDTCVARSRASRAGVTV
jgi:hypothetical protein